MMLKTGLEVAQDYTVFNYVPPIPQKDLNSQDRTIVSGPGMNLEKNCSPREQQREN